MALEEIFEARNRIKEEIADEYRSSLYALSTGLLKFNDVNLDTHGDIINCLEANIERKLLCVPRGCLKSSLACVAYPIWRIIRDPDIRILIDSELYTNSCTFLRQIKINLESQLFQTLFGRFRSRVWNESEIIVSQRTKPLKEASITVGGIGTTKVGQHYDLIIGDDYNSPKNSNTPDNAAKVVDHYKYNLSILEPDGEYVVIGTRYSDADLIGYILQHEIGIQEFPKTGVYATAA
jgi:hypothetical protein